MPGISHSESTITRGNPSAKNNMHGPMYHNVKVLIQSPVCPYPNTRWLLFHPAILSSYCIICINIQSFNYLCSLVIFVFTCVASQHLILCDITAATTAVTPRFLKFQNSQPNLTEASLAPGIVQL